MSSYRFLESLLWTECGGNSGLFGILIAIFAETGVNKNATATASPEYKKGLYIIRTYSALMFYFQYVAVSSAVQVTIILQIGKFTLSQST